jgi:phosphate-selective porin OprO/OprP
VRVGRDGFVLESEDRAFVLKIRGYLQGDGRLFVDAGDSGPPHTFVVRRARPILEGTVFRYFGFRLMPDFGGGTATVQDAHVDARPLSELSFRVGKFKAPFGIERLMNAPNLLFVERAFPTLLAPNREIGVEVYGDLWDGTLTYAVGVFNGVADGGSTDGDTDEGKDVIGRIFAHPLRPLAIPALRGLGLGFAASWGRARGTLETPSLPSFKTSGQQTFFRYLAGDTIDVTAVADGDRYRISPQLYYFFGPFGLLSEYVASFQNVTLGAASTRLASHAWQAAATFVIGGDASYEGVRPARAVGEGGAGAFELAGRYHELRIDPDAFPTFADPAQSARLARGFTVGVGWWANRSFRVMADFDRTTFEGGASGVGNRRPENMVLGRTQVAW